MRNCRTDHASFAIDNHLNHLLVLQAFSKSHIRGALSVAKRVTQCRLILTREQGQFLTTSLKRALVRRL